MDNYNNELESLSNQVHQFDTTSPSVPTLDGETEPVSTSGLSIWYNKYFEYGMYAAIPVLILALIAAIRPSFTQVEYTDEEGNESAKTSWTKVILWGVMISIPLVVGVYIFMKKKKE
jgi:hypothetical protein